MSIEPWTLQRQCLQKQLLRSLGKVAQGMTVCLELLDPIGASSSAQESNQNSDQDSAQDFKMSPALTIQQQTPPQTVRWALDIDISRATQFAQRGVAEYWSLDTQQVALRRHCLPAAAGYQQQQLFQVGDRIHPAAFPNLTFQLQEPLPLYFLTRTATGQRTHLYTRLPLKLL